MPDWRPTASRDTVAFRNQVLARIRQHFQNTGALEVAAPVLSRYANPEPHFTPLRVHFGGGDLELATSPEMHLKRLLACGWGDVWSLATCVRGGEQSAVHNQEFAMLEWYRCGVSLQALAAETLQVANLALREKAKDKAVDADALQSTTYQALFQECTDFDWHNSSLLCEYAQDHNLAVFAGDAIHLEATRDLIFAERVETQLLADEKSLLVYAFPPDLAALARINSEGEHAFADRFELYLHGLEIANGYNELQDPGEYLERARDWNAKRETPIQPNTALLNAMSEGTLPDCCGVALGFDRLLMLATGATSLAQIQLFGDGEA